MIPPTYKPKTKFMQLAIAEAKRARDRGDYAIGAVITQLIGNREVVIASAGNRVKTSGSSIKHVELETLKYVSSGYGRYLPDFVLYSTHEPCAMCAGACVWSKIGAVVFGVSQEDITAYGKKHGTEEFKWRACLISCKFVLEKGGLHNARATHSDPVETFPLGVPETGLHGPKDEARFSKIVRQPRAHPECCLLPGTASRTKHASTRVAPAPS